MSVALRAVCATYGGCAAALNEIDLRVAVGERVAIIGPSGAGKSTLLRLLATAEQPSAGELSLLDAQPWSEGSRARQQLRKRIGLIHQAPPLPPRQRVITSVAAGRLGQWSVAKSLLNLIYPLDIETISATLARFDLADKVFDRCDQLSGGELQRVGIARVLYQQPELVLADEPVSAMDPVLAEHTLAVLNHQAQARQVTLITSLHNVELALRHFPRVIGLRDGRILFDKAASDVSRDELAELYANEQLQAPAVVTSPTAPIPCC